MKGEGVGIESRRLWHLYSDDKITAAELNNRIADLRGETSGSSLPGKEARALDSAATTPRERRPHSFQRPTKCGHCAEVDDKWQKRADING